MGGPQENKNPGMTDGSSAVAAGTQLERSPRRLLIVSDIRILREGLAEVLGRDRNFLLVGVASSIEEAMAVAAFQPPQIILIDATLPDGITAVSRLRESVAEAQLIALALGETEDAVIAWAEAGVCGYVPRSAALNELIDCIDSVLRGEQVCSTRVAGGLLRRLAAGAPVRGTPDARHRIAPLTKREHEIVRCLADGLSDKEIARLLNIGLATAKSHVHNVLGKLMLVRRAQVARWVRTNELPFALDEALTRRAGSAGGAGVAQSSLNRVMDCLPDEAEGSLRGKRL
jgi:DNA-binding NarL/FixJ family response regulator